MATIRLGPGVVAELKPMSIGEVLADDPALKKNQNIKFQIPNHFGAWNLGFGILLREGPKEKYITSSFRWNKYPIF